MAKHKQPGLAPGTLIYTGPQRDEPIEIHVFDYNEGTFLESDALTDDVFERSQSPETTTWVNISGVHDVDIVRRIGDELDLHKLVMEDIVHPTQRPKLERYDDDSLYIVVKMLHYDAEEVLHQEQVSIVLTSTHVYSFQEQPGDVFEPVRNRLRAGKGIIRAMGPDYLAYALLDTIVDHYFFVIEVMGEEIDDIEVEVLGNPTQSTVARINAAKREVMTIRKSIWPLREVLSAMSRDDSQLIQPQTEAYLRDVYDHTIQVVDMLETYRDLLSGLNDLYLSSISHKMNEIMKVLTIMGSIFIPLTFVAGIYGMNFDVMPELHWKYGYFAAWGIMVSIGVVLLYYFRRKKWL